MIRLYLLRSILTIEIVTELLLFQFQKVKSLNSLTFIGFLLPSC